MKRIDWIMCGTIVVLYVLLLFIFKRDIFFYQFDETLLERYSRSQDITHEVTNRIFLSDSDVYLATGYLYANGSDPSANNFEHPPLVKYLFGFSVRLFGNPFVAQVLLGMGVLITLYLLTKKVFESSATSTIAVGLLLVDPLFIDLSSQPLLDMGQTFFLLLYFLACFYYKKNFVFQGIMLGLFASTKFWIPAFFFIGLFGVYKLYKKDLNYKHFMYHLVIAFLTYTLLYTQTFILKNGQFNILWHFLKTIKYRLQHNTSLYLGASLIMYTTSYVKEWWGDYNIVSTRPWSILWPFSLFVTIWQSVRQITRKNINEKLVIALIPLGYLCFLGVQAPFSRYFFPVLPFSYMVLAAFIYGKFLKRNH